MSSTLGFVARMASGGTALQSSAFAAPQRDTSRETGAARNRAFTLLEVMLALALLVGLIAALWAFLGNLQLSQHSVNDEVEQHVAATHILDCLEQQLAQSIAGVPGGGGEAGAGVTGAATSIRVLARGVPIVVQGSADQPLGGDLVATSLACDEGSSTMQFEQKTIGGGGSSVSSRVGSVGALRFRYFDGTTWSDHFDSAARGGLPPAVEVSIWFNKPPSDDSSTAPSPSTTPKPVLTKSSPDETPSPASTLPLPKVPADRVRIISIPDAATLTEKAA